MEDAMVKIETGQENEEDTKNIQIQPISLGKVKTEPYEDDGSLDVKEEIDIGPTQLQRKKGVGNSSDNEDVNIVSGEVKSENSSGPINKSTTSKDDEGRKSKKRDAYICKICGTSFCSIRRFIEHNKNHNSGESYECGLCGKEFVSVINLERHKKKYHHVECAVCQEVFFTKDDLKNHKKEKHKKFFECEDCHKVYMNRKNFVRHIGIHVGSFKPVKIKCDICGKIFFSVSGLLRHKKAHAGRKTFECDICNKKLSTKTILKVHLFSHTGQRPYECDICKKRFIDKPSLRQHIGLHTRTNKDLVACDVCGERFWEKSLYRHQKKHEGVTFNCDLCDEKFRIEIQLERHRAAAHTAHELFECTICDKKYVLQSDLITHQLEHAGERPFECDVCHMRFEEEVFLKNHSKVHSNAKPFECDVCKRYFTRKSTLNSHKRLHTGEKLYYRCRTCGNTFACHQSAKIHKACGYKICAYDIIIVYS